MKNKNKAGGLVSPAFLVLAVLFMWLSFPNVLVPEGFGLGAWLVPFFVALFIRSSERIQGALAGGFFFGALSFLLAMYWLGTYHAVASMVNVLGNGIIHGILFVMLAILQRGMPRLHHFVAPFLWIGCEYLRGLGFLGSPYLVLGYSQYRIEPMVQLASIGGVWLPGLVMTYLGWFMAHMLDFRPDGFPRGLRLGWSTLAQGLALVLGIGSLLGLAWISRVDTSVGKAHRIALIQHNIDPWKGGTPAYRRNLDILTKLSETVPVGDVDLLVWSETAFVPAIDWHLRYREDPERLALVRDLLSWLEARNVPVLFGQNHAERVSERGTWRRDDYNSTVLWNGGMAQRYDKLRLVPFSESFPWRNEFPDFYQWLLANDTHIWTPGKETTVFTVDGMDFSTPICFEDSFGYLCRDFVRAGARVLVTVSNDTWANSVPAMEQHLAMAVFRSAETRTPQVRASNGGMTVAIDANGGIYASLPPNREGVLRVEVHAGKAPWTPYLAWGDWLGVLGLGAGGLGVLAAVVIIVVDSVRKKAQYRTQR